MLGKCVRNLLVKWTWTVTEFVIGLMRLILMEKSCEFQCFENVSDTRIVLECTKNLFKVHHHWRTNILSIQAWCHASSCQWLPITYSLCVQHCNNDKCVTSTCFRIRVNIILVNTIEQAKRNMPVQSFLLPNKKYTYFRTCFVIPIKWGKEASLNVIFNSPTP